MAPFRRMDLFQPPRIHARISSRMRFVTLTGWFAAIRVFTFIRLTIEGFWF